MAFPAASRLYSAPLPSAANDDAVEVRPADTMTDAEVDATNLLGSGRINVPGTSLVRSNNKAGRNDDTSSGRRDATECYPHTGSYVSMLGTARLRFPDGSAFQTEHEDAQGRQGEFGGVGLVVDIIVVCDDAA